MRKSRIYSRTELYHVVDRGVNRQNIFYEEDDKDKFMQLIKKYKEKYDVEIHNVVLMDNHFHLQIKTPGKNISKFMQVLTSIYARYFNKKYDRIGHLFQSRFLSEPILDDDYYKTVFRYILQNPVRANLCKTMNYKWSSYRLYKSNNSLISNYIVEKYFGDLKTLYDFINIKNEDECLDIELKSSEKEFNLIKKVKKILKSNSPIIPPDLSIEEIKKKIKLLKNNGLSIRSISRITGITLWIVARA